MTTTLALDLEIIDFLAAYSPLSETTAIIRTLEDSHPLGEILRALRKSTRPDVRAKATRLYDEWLGQKICVI